MINLIDDKLAMINLMCGMHLIYVASLYTDYADNAHCHMTIATSLVGTTSSTLLRVFRKPVTY